jgi:heme-degrading monooxygenase HmoA
MRRAQIKQGCTLAAVDAAPLVTLSLYGFSGAARAWAFAQMGLARPRMAGVEGLRFWKLLGSGRGGGFSLRPDWSRYGLVAAWETPEAADVFFASSPVAAAYRERADEVWTVRLRPTSAHGAWSGANPFLPTAPGPARGPVAVLTRATIRWRRLAAFWGAVPASGRALDGAAGLLASIGVGEAPVVRQATFSLWASEEHMRAFAYGTAEHRETIRRTREERWYAEELFARFAPVASEGAWNGRDPLEGVR